MTRLRGVTRLTVTPRSLANVLGPGPPQHAIETEARLPPPDLIKSRTFTLTLVLDL